MTDAVLLFANTMMEMVATMRIIVNSFVKVVQIKPITFERKLAQQRNGEVIITAANLTAMLKASLKAVDNELCILKQLMVNV